MLTLSTSPRIHFFEKIAPYYDTLLGLLTMGMYARFLRRAVEILDPKEGEKVLDLCAGTGRVASWIARAVGEEGEVIGMDVAKPMVEIAKDRYGKMGNINFLQRDVTEPWSYRSNFDGIFASFCLHELPEGERKGVLERSYLALKEKGRMVIADFNPQISGTGRGLLLTFFKFFEKENLNFFSFNQQEMLKSVGFERIEIFSNLINLLQITLVHRRAG